VADSLPKQPNGVLYLGELDVLEGGETGANTSSDPNCPAGTREKERAKDPRGASEVENVLGGKVGANLYKKRRQCGVGTRKGKRELTSARMSRGIVSKSFKLSGPAACPCFCAVSSWSFSVIREF
jgi:hypothetical protein